MEREQWGYAPSYHLRLLISAVSRYLAIFLERHAAIDLCVVKLLGRCAVEAETEVWIVRICIEGWFAR
jgi:hypothetical protein